MVEWEDEAIMEPVVIEDVEQEEEDAVEVEEEVVEQLIDSIDNAGSHT